MDVGLAGKAFSIVQAGILLIISSLPISPADLRVPDHFQS